MFHLVQTSLILDQLLVVDAFVYFELILVREFEHFFIYSLILFLQEAVDL